MTQLGQQRQVLANEHPRRARGNRLGITNRADLAPEEEEAISKNPRGGRTKYQEPNSKGRFLELGSWFFPRRGLEFGSWFFLVGHRVLTQLWDWSSAVGDNRVRPALRVDPLGAEIDSQVVENGGA